MKTGDIPRILIVDDSPVNVQILAEGLKADYHIKVANSGAGALKSATSNEPPDLILLDAMMPEMDGYEVCRRLAAGDATRNIPIIFVTASHDAADEEYGLNLGAADYITKPFHLPIVKARVRNHLLLKQKTDMLESLAQMDGLTNIPNRRRLEEVLAVEWRRASRSQTPISVVMLDIDHFKPFNDHYGHGVGDICLKAVAQALQSMLSRPADMVARYGGEEFAAVLPGVDFTGAGAVAENFRQAVYSLHLPHALSSVLDQVTISAGFASCSIPAGDSYTGLLAAADKMLYQAKSAGRNRVCGAKLTAMSC